MPTLTDDKHSFGSVQVHKSSVWNFHRTGVMAKSHGSGASRLSWSRCFIDDILVTGHTRDEQEESNNVTDDQATINVTPGMVDQDGTEQVPIISPENTEATAFLLTRCSQREQKPTKRLIKEMN